MFSNFFNINIFLLFKNYESLLLFVQHETGIRLFSKFTARGGTEYVTVYIKNIYNINNL